MSKLERTKPRAALLGAFSFAMIVLLTAALVACVSACNNDQQVIDRHKQTLEEEDE